MRILITPILLLSLYSSVVAQFTEYKTPGIPPAVVSIHAKEGHIFAGSYQGVLYASTSFDTGWNRYSIPVPTNHSITSIASFSGKWLVSHRVISNSLSSEGGVMASSDSGKTWTPFNSGLPTYPKPPSETMNLAPKFFEDQDRLFALTANFNGVSILSSDGSTWESRVNGLPSNVSMSAMIRVADTLFISVNVGANTSLPATRIYRSLDYGGHWSGFTTNLQMGVIQDLIHSEGVLYVGTSIGLYKSLDYGRSWIPTNKPAGYMATVNMGVLPDGKIVLSELATANFYSSSDGGTTWQTLDESNLRYSGVGTKIINAEGTFFLGTRQNINTGFNGLYYSQNNGHSWTLVEPLTDGFHQATAIKYFGGAYFIQTANGVYKTTDFNSWELFGGVRREIFHVDSRAGVVYAAGPGTLRYSQDQGQSWISATQGLSAIDHFSLSFFADLDTLYVGLPTGLFARTSETEPWELRTNGLQVHPIRRMIRIGEYLFMMTRNHGVFVSRNGYDWESRSIGLPNGHPFGPVLTPGDMIEVNGRLLIAFVTGLYSSDDFGLTWSKSTSAYSIPNPQCCFVRLARNGTRLFHSYPNFGVSVYSSNDDGSTWAVASDVEIPFFHDWIDQNQRFVLVNTSILTSVGSSVSIEDRPIISESAKSLELYSNYPNPFNPSTEIRYRKSEIGQTRLTVYDLIGREIAVLVNGVMPAGTHSVSFDASNLSSGVYLYRLESAGEVLTRKMVLLK